MSPDLPGRLFTTNATWEAHAVTTCHWKQYYLQALIWGLPCMAPHSSTLAWKIPWMEEPGRLQSTGSWRVGHDWVTFTFHFHALEKEMATHSSVLAWRIPGTGAPGWAAVYGVAQSRTRLKQLSSSSSMWILYFSINFPYPSPEIKTFPISLRGFPGHKIFRFSCKIWDCHKQTRMVVHLFHEIS